MKADGIHLNLNVRGLGPSATLAIDARARELERNGRRIVKLGLGQSPFPVPQVVVEELRRHAEQKAYLPVKGLPRLREAVAEHHARTFGIACDPECVMVGPGSKELMFLLQLCYYGDLMIPAPAWVSYEPQAQIIGRRIVRLPTRSDNGWKITPDQIDSACRSDPTRPRLLILNDPSNPTGVGYDADELRALAEVAAHYEIVLLSDEIYAKLHHENRHASIVPLYPEATIFSGGLSKWCGAGGWRLGVFVVPASLGWLADALAAAASETFTSTSAPIQYAAVRAFEGGPEIDRYLDTVRAILRGLGRRLHARLERAGAEVAKPDGGFYLFPDFEPLRERLAARGVHSGAELAERLLLEPGVAVLPGAAFGLPESSLALRLSYVDFDGGRALEAAADCGDDLDDEFFSTYCGPTVKGVDALCEWIAS